MIRHSWSSLKAFLTCPAKFEFGYREGLESRRKSTRRAPTIGSAVHAGIALVLQTGGDVDNPDGIVAVARAGVKQWFVDNTEKNKTIFSDTFNAEVPDNDYYLMMADAEKTALDIVTYQVPRLELGTRYVPAVSHELSQAPLGPGDTADTPLVEFKFEGELDGLALSGIVDAILFDKENQTYVVVDWKVRSVFQPEYLIALDGQLHLYAAVINKIAEAAGGDLRITRAIQWQLRNGVPKQAVLTQKLVPSMANISSTWEVWSASVEKLGFKPSHYQEMREKLQSPEHFTKPVEFIINEDSSHQALVNASALASKVEQYEATGVWPHVYSSDVCRFCPFSRICLIERYGGDASEVKARHYERRVRSLTEEVPDEQLEQ